jgi:glucose/arabinose dehydrogenase
MEWYVLNPPCFYGKANPRFWDQATPPALTFQAHSAPIDSKFDATFSNLYVTFHGSWNRAPTTGFKLVVVPFTKGTDGAYRPVSPGT